VARLLPRAFRAPIDDELERAAMAWVARGRARAGRLGAARVWLAIIADTVRMAVVLRLPERPTAGLGADVRPALRMLARSPGFAAAAVTTFALGIGVNLAVLSVVDRMMFRPLPYGDAGRLVHIRMSRLAGGGPSPEAYLPDLVRERLRARAASFEDVADAEGRQDPIAIDALGAPLILDTVSVNLLRVLRVRPSAGRDFIDDDAARGQPRGILLTDEAWEQRTARAPDLLSRSFTSDGDAYRVVGVLPRGFLVPASAFAGRVDGVVVHAHEATSGPIDLGPSAVGRLRPGVALERAQAEVDLVAAQLSREYPDSARFREPMIVQPLHSGLFVYYRPYVWLIVAGVAAVFLVACVNLATLFLARGRSRQQDMAVRAALGASRARLVRAAIAESVVLCLISAGVAIVVCRWIFDAMMALVPAALHAVAVSPLDVRLVGLTLVAALAAALVSGGIPALRASRADVTIGLRRQSRSTTARLRGGAALIACQAALGALLVAGALATVRSFLGMVLESPGFEVEGLFEVRTGHGTEPDRAAALGAQLRAALTGASVPTTIPLGYSWPRVRDVVETLRSAPGVLAASAVSRMPVGQPVSGRDAFWAARGERGVRIGIGGRFFATLRTPILAGRDLTDADVASQASIVIVNDAARRRLWPGTRPAETIGLALNTESGRHTVVGVVADLSPLPGAAPVPAIFLPITAPDVPFTSSLTVAVRAAPGAPPDLAALDARLDARFGRYTARMTQVADALPPHLQRPRFQAVLFGSVAVIALIVAAVGLYAIAAFDAARRRFEMGVRLTLGARPDDVRRLLIRGAVTPVALGTLAGLVVGWWLLPFLQPFVFEVDARDPWSAALVAVVLVATAVVAAWLPARRVAATDPTMVLRAI
jgi:putative ABC transport system permease protein